MLIKKHNDHTERIQLELDDQIRLELVGFAKCPPARRGYLHSHPFWELIYINKGRGLFDYRKNKCVLQADNLYLVEPHKKHRLVNDGKDILEVLYTGFSFDFHPNKILRKCRNFPVFQGLPEEVIFKNEFREIAELLSNGGENVFEGERGRMIGMLAQITDYLTCEGNIPTGTQSMRLDIITDKVKQYLPLPTLVWLSPTGSG